MIQARKGPLRMTQGTIYPPDESVEHSWDTVPVAVTVDVDRGIAPLVMVLNRIPGCRTYVSCMGHQRLAAPVVGVAREVTDQMGWAYVEIGYRASVERYDALGSEERSKLFMDRVRQILRPLGHCWRLENGQTPWTPTLWVDPARISDVARALCILATNSDAL